MLEVTDGSGCKFPNLLAAWQHWGSAIRTQDILLIPNPSLTGGKAGDINLKVGTLQKRVFTLVDALLNEIKVKPGERVVVLSEDPEDLAVILHACWLTHQVVIPIDPELPSDSSFAIFENCNVKTVIFPPELSARIAYSISKAQSVKNWLVSGNATLLPPTPGIKRLDKIMAGAAGGPAPELQNTNEDILALVNLVGDDESIRGLSFTHSQLLSAAESYAALYPSDGFQSLNWTTLIPQSIEAIVQTFLTPFFSAIPSLLKFRVEPRSFWDVVSRNEVGSALVDFSQLSAMRNRSRNKIGVDIARFKLYVASSRPMSGQVFADFRKLLPVNLCPCLSIPEAGGIVTAFPLDLERDETTALIQSERPSLGIAVPGVGFEIRADDGSKVAANSEGQICVRSSQCMTSYMGTQPGEMTFSADGYLMTQLRGLYKLDSLGRKHLYQVGD